MQVKDYEKLGAFYLGRPHDLASGETASGPLLYGSKDLVTHAVCVGMTGSGKTGLCIDLIEEAALDQIPALLIDPKGDLGNLLLTFPDLAPEDFRPWINEGDAERAGMTPSEFAAQQAEMWREGLAEWNQDGQRIRRLRESVEMRIYTPGSSAGLPVSILASLAAPAPQLLEQPDLFGDRVAVTATSFLSLLGIEADPVQSREHLLLSSLFDHAWRAGRDLDLPSLIRGIQHPPVQRLGVMELESFYPAEDRFELAMRCNNLLAAPSFATWLQGVPLEIDRLLYSPEGKPRIAIFSIAHLSDAERMFFVSLLLNETLSWVRTRAGTTSLRALLYMDEVFGYLPPVAKPPSKRPLMTLLKQGRAFGFGVVLATQNPVDLDYKALSNAGTWFLGRLQTERDKARVLEGLEGVAASQQGFDRAAMEETLAGLGKRVFLLHNVHDEAPTVFRTRWAMSYLRGPLTRHQISRLMDPIREETRQSWGSETQAASHGFEARLEADESAAGGARPVLPSEIRQVFLPSSAGSVDLYRPQVLGTANVHYVKRGVDVEHDESLILAADLDSSARNPCWAEAARLELRPEDLLDGPESSDAGYGALPAPASQLDSYSDWESELSDWIYDNCRVPLWHSRVFDVLSQPGETEKGFRVRLSQVAREERDRRTEELRSQFQEDLESHMEKIQDARDRIANEQGQAKSAKLSTWVSAGLAVLSGIFGRKRLSYSTMSRAGSAVRGWSRAHQQEEDVEQAEAELQELLTEQEELRAKIETAIDTLDEKLNALDEDLEKVELAPRRRDVEVRFVALAWVPD